MSLADSLAALDIDIKHPRVPPVIAMARHFTAVFSSKDLNSASSFSDNAVTVGAANRFLSDLDELRENPAFRMLEAAFGETFVIDLAQWFGACLQHLEFCVGSRLDLLERPKEREARSRSRDALRTIVKSLLAEEAELS